VDAKPAIHREQAGVKGAFMSMKRTGEPLGPGSSTPTTATSVPLAIVNYQTFAEPGQMRTFSWVDG
jgi:hypothetical protein